MKPTNQIGTADFFNRPLPKDRRPIDRPRSKDKDFGSMLHSSPKTKREIARKTEGHMTNASERQPNNNKIREKIDSRAQEWKQRPTIRKPSRALRSWGRKLAKGEGGLERFPALSFLEGKANQEVAKQLPQMLTQENSFLAQAIGGDLKVIMHSQFRLGDLVDMLGLSQAFMAEAEAIGLDPNEVVSPKQFFQSLGIDPHKVIAEIDRLKAQLSKDGLGAYLNAHTKTKNKHHGIHPNQSKKAEKPIETEKPKTLYPIKKLSQSPELNDLWQAPAEQHDVTQKARVKGDNPFTNLEKTQLQSMQSKQTPTQTLGSLEHGQIKTQKHGIVQQQASAFRDHGDIKPGQNQTEIDKLQSLPIHNSFLKPKKSVKQASPNLFENNDLSHSLLTKVKPETKVSELKNTKHGIDKKVAFDLPRSSVSKNLTELFKNENIINKSLSQDLEINTFANPQNIHQQKSHLGLQQQTENLQQTNKNRVDFGVDLGNIVVANKQQMPSNSFESVQRQLKSPFSNIDHSEVQLSEEEISQSDAEQTTDFSLARPNPVNLAKQRVSAQTKLAKPRVISDIFASRAESNNGLDSLKSEEPKTPKSKLSLEAPESPELDSLLKPGEQNSSALVQDAASELSPELSFEARQEMLDKIAEQSLNLNRQGGGRANISISDKNFGDLSLAVQVDGNEVQLKMHSPSDQIRNLLGQDLGNLKETLSGQNLNLVQVDVSNNEYGHESQNHNNNFQFFEQQQRQQFSDSPNQGTLLKTRTPDRSEILNINNTAQNLPNVSHNLLSKHIQVAA